MSAVETKRGGKKGSADGKMAGMGGVFIYTSKFGFFAEETMGSPTERLS